jgi:hypothetical protein
MKSSNGVRMLKKAHMESEGTFGCIRSGPSYAPSHAAVELMKPHSQMAIEGFEQRKLAAIMFTDMVGYGTLAQRDEGLAPQKLIDKTLSYQSFAAGKGDAKLNSKSATVQFKPGHHRSKPASTDMSNIIAATRSPT